MTRKAAIAWFLYDTLVGLLSVFKQVSMALTVVFFAYLFITDTVICTFMMIGGAWLAVGPFIRDHVRCFRYRKERDHD